MRARLGIRFRPRIIFTLFLLGLFAFAVVAVRDMQFNARIYPWVIGFPAIGLLLFQLAKDLGLAVPGGRSDEGVGGADIEFTAEEATPAGLRKTLELFAWIYGFVLALWLFGYPVGIPLMVFAYLRRHGESWLLSFLLPAGAFVLLWRVFDLVLHLPFPPGHLYDFPFPSGLPFE